ncbi:MAG: glutamine--tRNA ligase/YqeY domain fusion protein [Christensenellales bacterium]|jgi:glutaminyl-tRNA synthetase
METERKLPEPSNFIEEFINQDLLAGKNHGRVHTRFPPEPNGYLHIGHVKAFCIDFEIAQKYGGKCNLRFDDTNPTKEDTEYVEAIMDDIRWMGFDWYELHYASDFFDELYEKARELIRKGLAYVDDLSGEEIRAYRGTLTQPGKNSPYRDRSVEENLDLFERMKNGEFPDGSRVLRAKIDMASPNVILRDPVIYRILRHHHHRTGDKWCIYPMYDFQHPLQDAIEGITHSLCSLEYEIHRPLYDWVVRSLDFPEPPRQIEFARLNITRTIMSKRYLRRLVEEGHVSGWDDPRMPTLVAMRRRGYPAAAIRDFIHRVGVAKADSVVEAALLEHCVREALSDTAPRGMAVLHPVKVIVENYPEGKQETFTMPNHPAHPELGEREITFSRELFIEAEDFMETPPPKFFRMTPGKEVRLMGAYIVKCERVEKDEAGNITAIICTYDPESRSGGPTAGRKVKGTLHWVNAADAVPAEVRLYEPLMNDDVQDEAEPVEGEEAEAAPAKADFIDSLNPNSLSVVQALVEPALAKAQVKDTFQFMRTGYFCMDPDSTPDKPVFNRTVPLKDSWSKIANR